MVARKRLSIGTDYVNTEDTKYTTGHSCGNDFSSGLGEQSCAKLDKNAQLDRRRDQHLGSH